MNDRVDPKEFKATMKLAEEGLDQVLSALRKHLELLTPEERKRTLKPPDDFMTAGRTLARATEAHPAIAESTDYDAKAVIEDLDNVVALQPVMEKTVEVQQLLADARLRWLAESYVPSLQVYGVAKVIARLNAEVQKLVAPLARVFGTGRERKNEL